MRPLLLAALFFAAYHLLLALGRWLLQRPPGVEEPSPGGELVRDPECGVYVLKERAVTRRVQGRSLHFCGEECAAAHAAKHPG